MTAPRAALYLRVSTDKQEEENQRPALEGLCRARGWEIVNEYADVESGGDPARLGLNELMHDAARRRFDAIIFWAWDRITRDPRPDAIFAYMQRWQALGIAWESIQEPFLSSSSSDPALRDLLARIIGWLNAQERRRISERTKAGMASRRNLGIHVGRPKGAKDKKPRRPKG